MMAEITPGNWEALASLSRRLDIPDDRVRAVQRQSEPDQVRPGSPYVLLAGGGGLELLLARWLQPEVAEALIGEGRRPLVVGPSPSEVRPKLGQWKGYPSKSLSSFHLIALRSEGKPPADVLAQLNSLGYVDRLVLVTSLHQPFRQTERELARSLAAVAAVVQVLIVAVPGQEPTSGEIAELRALALAQIGREGFTDGRCLDAEVWFTDGEARPGTLADVGRFVTTAPGLPSTAHAGMIRRRVAGLLKEFRDKAKSTSIVPTLAVSNQDQDRLTGELNGYLSDLGHELDRRAAERKGQTADSLRAYALDQFRGWGAYLSIEGMWLKYVETLRPGTQAALLTEAESALKDFDFDPGHPAIPDDRQATLAPAMDRVTALAIRLGVGLLVGIAVYLAVSYLLTLSVAPNLPEQGVAGEAKTPAEAVRPNGARLPEWLVTILSVLGLIVGGVLGYAAAGRLVRPRIAASQRTDKHALPALQGWSQVQSRLTTWFREAIRANLNSPSSAEDCRSTAKRFGIPEEELDQ